MTNEIIAIVMQSEMLTCVILGAFGTGSVFGISPTCINPSGL